MKHLSIFTKCIYKKLKRKYFLPLLFTLFWGIGTTAVAGKVEITGFVSGTLSIRLSAENLSEIDTLIIRGNALDNNDVYYLQHQQSELKSNLFRLELDGASLVPNGAFEDFLRLNSVSLSGVSNPPGIVIGERAFYGSGITNITLNNVKEVKSSAFQGCTHLSSLGNISSLETIGDNAFYNCKALRPSNTRTNSLANVKTIGDYAFYGCSSTSFTGVDLSSATHLGKGAFEGCTSLENVVFRWDDPPTTISENTFYNNAIDFTSEEDFPDWVMRIILNSDNHLIWGQKPKVDFTLSPPSKTVLWHANNFESIKPIENINTKNGNYDYNTLIDNAPGWLASGLTRPIVKIYDSGGEMSPLDLDNLLNSVGTYPLTYYIFQNGITIGYTDFTLKVASFVGCDGATGKATTSKLTISLPEDRTYFNASQILIEPANAVIVGEPVKLNAITGSVWEVTLTNIVAGDVLIKILTGNTEGNYGYPGGGEQLITLKKGPTLWFDRQGGTLDPEPEEIENLKLVTENGEWGKLVTYYDYVIPYATIGELPEPSRNGYTFNGWFSNPNGMIPQGIRYNSGMQYQQEGDITVYAHWTPRNDYTIILDPNGGIMVPEIIENITYNDTIRRGIPFPTPTRTGYNFINWNISPDGTGDIYTNDSIYRIAQDTTILYAHWEVKNGLRITFIPGEDGQVNPAYIDTFTYGLPIDTLPVPTRPGYSFTDWYTLENGMGDRYRIGDLYLVDGDTTLYALWTPRNDYTIILDPNGGIMVPEIIENITYNDTIRRGIPFPTLTRTGYNFINWNISPDGTGDIYTNDSIYRIAQDTTILYAHWEVKNGLKITFIPGEDGQVNPAYIDTFTYGLPIDTLPVPTRPGYSFTDWYTLENGMGDRYRIGDLYLVDGDTTLYALWTPRNDYTIILDPNGGTMVPEIIENITYNDTIRRGIPFPAPTRTGYRFINWNTLPDGTGDIYTNDTIYRIAGDTTLYAYWEIKTGLKVTFIPGENGQVEPAYIDTFTYGLPIDTLPAPTRPGYNFTDWYTLENGMGQNYRIGDLYLIDGDTTFYAHWEAKTGLKITFIPGADAQVVPAYIDTFTYGLPIDTLPVPTRPGYTFIVWNTLENGMGENYRTGDLYLVDGDTTLYAQWEANSYRITLESNGGEVTPSYKMVTYNTEIGNLPLPVRSGYAFTGWNMLQNNGERYESGMRYEWITHTTFYAQWRRLSENTNISDINVDNSTEDEYDDGSGIPSLFFLMNCGHESAFVSLTIEDPNTQILYGGEVMGSRFEIPLGERYGVIPITLTVRAEAGNTRDTMFYIAKRFPFEQVVITRWDNTMTVINNPQNNGGFHFRSYEWYVNGEYPGGQLLTDKQSYSAGRDGRSLNPNTSYYVVLTADEYESGLPTCIGHPAMRQQPMTMVYPNPVQANTALTIEIDEELPEADIEIYNVSGALLRRGRTTGRVNTLNLPYPAGTYLVRVNGETTTIIVE